MAQLTVRQLDPELVRALKLRAAQNNRSAEAEHRALLEASLRPSPSDFWRTAATLRAETASRPQTDSALLIRADRDRAPRGPSR